MLKVMRGKLMFVVPDYWLDSYGFLKPTAVCTLKVFFGAKTNEEADRELKKREKNPKRGWYRFNNLRGDDMIEV